jgi:hypothetical protein
MPAMRHALDTILVLDSSRGGSDCSRALQILDVEIFFRFALHRETSQ